MIRRGLFVEAVTAAVLGIAWVFVNSTSMKGSLERQRDYGLRRLEKATVAILSRAHRVNDDLMTQEVVTGLSKAPGILFACVVGKEGKILAHSQPSQLGRTFHQSALPVWVSPLEEGQVQWGKLIIASSDRTLQEAWIHELILWSLGAAALWLGWVARSWVWRQRLAERDRRAAELTALLQEQAQKQTRENEKHAEARNQWILWLQCAAEQVPLGLMILDQKQRVVAANARAASSFGLADPASLRGLSWYELPPSDFTNAALEQSLQAPGKRIPLALPSHGLHLEFSSFNDGLGTCVTLQTAKNLLN